MTQYTLNVDFLPADLEKLSATGFKLTLVKGVLRQDAQGVTVFASVSPFEHNEFTWQGACGVYASPVSAAAALVPMSSVYPASIGMTYPFKPSNTFGTPTAGEEGTLTVENGTETALRVGLLQSVSANESTSSLRPINAALLTHLQRAIFTPVEAITVFLFAQHDNNGVNETVTMAPFSLDMMNAQTQKIHYVGASDTFAFGPLG